MEREKILNDLLANLKKKPKIYKRMIEKVEKELKNVSSREESRRI